MLNFEINRKALHEVAIRERPDPKIGPGQAVLRIDKFALTANNITYAALGSELRYWDFFPASNADHGIAPVWGFAEVIRSSVPNLSEGERLYGYMPMASHFVIEPVDAPSDRVVDVSPHREGLPKGVYDVYLRTASDRDYDSRREPEIALFRPLFATALVLDDFLTRDRGGGSIIISSASSKTAISLAFLLSRRPHRPHIVGLTSQANETFVRNLGYYDAIVTYDDIERLAADAATYADFTGNKQLRARVHAALGSQLVRSIIVGSTNWNSRSGDWEVGGPPATRFFAPTEIVRIKERIGARQFSNDLSSALNGFTMATDAWLKIRNYRGADATREAYSMALEGKVKPEVGVIASLSADAHAL